jgi:hypothetical protein
LMVEECLMVAGTLAVCIREVQKSLTKSSSNGRGFKQSLVSSFSPLW